MRFVRRWLLIEIIWGLRIDFGGFGFKRLEGRVGISKGDREIVIIKVGGRLRECEVLESEGRKYV